MPLPTHYKQDTVRYFVCGGGRWDFLRV